MLEVNGGESCLLTGTGGAEGKVPGDCKVTIVICCYAAESLSARKVLHNAI